MIAAVTRAAGLRFLPLLDLFNHHNGLLNTRSHAEIVGNKLFSTENILAGEEIFHSYRGGLHQGGSPEIFRRYGFLESWPQEYAWGADLDHKSIHFLFGEDGNVVLYPPESLDTKIGSMNLAKDNILQASGAQRHNEALSSVQLSEFCASANHILNQLPTSLEEDDTILFDLLTPEDNSIRNLKETDKIQAVKYRMVVKRALQAALRAAESSLLRQGGNNGKRDEF